MRKLAFLFISVSLISAAPAFAWGPTGHRVIAEIAQTHLTPAALRQVQALLGGRTLADVANWADEIKGDPQFSKTSYLHYADVPSGFTDVRNAPVPAESNTVVALNALFQFMKTSDASAFEKVPALVKIDRAQALKFIVHFVGDLHQPLHVGDPADKGGNAVNVNWMNRYNTVLHSIWDDEIIDFERLSYSEFARYLDHASASDVKAWQTADPAAWANESLALRSQCYAYNDRQTQGQIPLISYNYINKNREVIRQRLLQGGIRLAYVLNSLFQ